MVPLLIIGVVLGLAAVPAIWAQALAVVRRGSTDGLSPAFVVMWTWSAATWAAHGALHHNVAQAVLELSSFMALLLVLTALIRSGRLGLGLAGGTTAAYAVALLALAVLGGRGGVGAAATVIAVACRVPQVRESWRNPTGSAISTGSFLLGAAVDGMWVVNGILVHDPVTIAVSAVCTAHGAFVGGRTLLARQPGRRTALLTHATAG